MGVTLSTGGSLSWWRNVWPEQAEAQTVSLLPSPAVAVRAGFVA